MMTLYLDNLRLLFAPPACEVKVWSMLKGFSSCFPRIVGSAPTSVEGTVYTSSFSGFF